MAARRKPRGEVVQLGFFDEPEPEPVPAPRGAKPARAPVKYEDYTVRSKCADCELLVYEQLRESGSSTHLIRSVRVKRTEAGQALLLCHEHAQLRQLAERK